MKRFRLILAGVLLAGALAGCDTVSPGTPGSATAPAAAPTGESLGTEGYPAPEVQSTEDYPAPDQGTQSQDTDSVYPTPQ